MQNGLFGIRRKSRIDTGHGADHQVLSIVLPDTAGVAMMPVYRDYLIHFQPNLPIKPYETFYLHNHTAPSNFLKIPANLKGMTNSGATYLNPDSLNTTR